MRKRKPHYVNNAEMHAELVKFNETGTISEELGSMFMKIAQKFATLPSFAKYSYKSDMISSAVERMVSQAHKFDVERTNPFAYFTQVTRNQFLHVLKKEKRVRELKQRYRTKIWDDLCSDEHMAQFKDANEEELEMEKSTNTEDDNE